GGGGHARALGAAVLQEPGQPRGGAAPGQQPRPLEGRGHARPRAAQARRLRAALPQPERGVAARGLPPLPHRDPRRPGGTQAGVRSQAPAATARPARVKPVRLVVFDLDGTLVDSVQDIATATNQALARVAPGTKPLPLAEVRAFVGEGATVLLERSLMRAGIAARADDVLPVFLERYRACLLATTRLYPGVAEALDALRGRPLA